MRRCQRLPEITHPGDPARPIRLTSKGMPVKKRPFFAEITAVDRFASPQEVRTQV
jgi:hypothetical protein